ncbi:MAG: bifunctional oligoribonuclease/PAP phosphatase NrnA [Flavobacterium sp.]
MKKEDIQAIKNLLATPKKIAIVPHRSPDGDAMGSSLAMYNYLIELNHEVTVVSPNQFPNFLAWLPASEKVLIYENDKENCADILRQAEIVFTLDFNALHRTGEMENVLNKLSATMIMIDHHQSPDGYAQYVYSDTKFGSTCEMIYNFIGFLGHKKYIDKNVATCIYSGIVTDTGSFRFSSTTSATHRVVADLIDLGVENSEVHNLIFNDNSFNRLQLLGRALQNMKVFPQYNTAYITLSQKELDEFHYEKGDTEGIVNYGLTIKGIHLAAIFIENKDEKIIKISFRSQGSFDVNQFAREYFSGGGHINAAGGKSNDSMEITLKKFEDLISKISI